MKKLFVALLAFITINAVAQTTVINDPNARARTLTGDFSTVSVATGIELFITQGNETSLAVSASDEKYLADFKTEVKGGTLKLYYDNNNGNNNNWQKGRVLKAYLSVKALKKMIASSGANIKTVNVFNATDLELRLSSGSGFDGEVKATSLVVDQSSGSEVNISGSAVSAEVETSSGSSFDGYGFSADKCSASASSGAEIKVTVNKELDASASSGARIRYKGNASTKEINKSSGGSVKKG